MTRTVAEVAGTIDHTLLKPETTADQINLLCDEASKWGFKAVCVNPVHVSQAAKRLSAGKDTGAGIAVPTVVSVSGFPLGACSTATKVDQAKRAVGEGATEIDMVARIGALVEGDYLSARNDIEVVARAIHGALANGILKVILETAALTAEEIEIGCRCCVDGGADFVKTSTGFHAAGGATAGHVRLLCQHAGQLRVKAAGGIRTAEHALAMLDAGAARLGTSSGVAILEQLSQGGG